jgi:hypothetical protein
MGLGVVALPGRWADVAVVADVTCRVGIGVAYPACDCRATLCVVPRTCEWEVLLSV